MYSLFSTRAGKKTGVINLDSKSFEKQMQNDKEAVLIDTRTLGEYEDARIPNSKLIDIMSPTFRDDIDQLDRSKSYYLYCRSGNRSYQAGMIMSKMGFEKVYNLEPGIIGWSGDIIY